MECFTLGRAEDPQFSPTIVDGMFQLRDEVFRQRLGWTVRSTDGRERDRFDDMSPHYVVAHDTGGNVHGCFRLLPTTGPYMLRDTFPQMLQGAAAPRNAGVWELSRLATRSPSPADRRQASLSTTTFGIIQSIFDFAVKNNITHYVTVTSAALERVLKKAGFPLIRMGAGKAVRIGSVLSVACEIPVNDQFYRALQITPDKAA